MQEIADAGPASVLVSLARSRARNPRRRLCECSRAVPTRELAPCVVEFRALCRSDLKTAPSFEPSRGARPRHGIRSGVPGPSWRSPRGSGPPPSPPGWSATSVRFVAPAASMRTRGYPGSSKSPGDRAGHEVFIGVYEQREAAEVTHGHSATA
jgi:hypothetical protein